MKSLFLKFAMSPLCGFFPIGNFSSSKTKQSAEQQTSQATGINSIATGRGSQVFKNIFGDKNLAKNDFTKPVAILAAAALGLFWLKRKGGK